MPPPGIGAPMSDDIGCRRPLAFFGEVAVPPMTSRPIRVAALDGAPPGARKKSR